MNALIVELLKLRRSLAWAVVLVLPLAIVFAGTINSLVTARPLDDGWHTLWLRTMVFHGLFSLPVRIAILGSLVWRVEHRHGNWNALLTGSASSLRILLGKAGAVWLLVAAMQAVHLIAVVGIGRFVFGLPGMLPGRYLGIAALIVLACLPVAVMQSGLSMLMRSFGAPLAVAFAGAGTGAVLLLAGVDAVILVLPYALVARATQLGTGVFADGGAISAAGVAVTAGAAVVMAGVLLIATATALERRDVVA